MTGKRFASCIMCFALTAALFSVSRGWASENEMNLTEESAEPVSIGGKMRQCCVCPV